MPLTPERRAEIESRITKLTNIRSKAEDALEGILSAEGVESFKFDSGEASAWAKYYSMKDLEKMIDSLDARISYLTNKLNGTGIVNVVLRRK